MAARPARRRRWRRAGLLALLAVGAVLVAWRAIVIAERPAFRLEPLAGAPGPETILVGPDHTRIADAVWSADGERLYVYLYTSALDLGALTLYRWPEIALVALGIAGLLVMRRLLRLRTEGRGSPCCRRCAYVIAPDTGEHCPECGLELIPHNRVYGRRRRGAAAVIAATMVLLAIGYAWGRHRMPRQEILGERALLASTAAYRLAHHLDLDGHDSFRVTTHQLVAIEPASGELLNVLTSFAGSTRDWHGLELSEDGSTLVMVAGDEIMVFDLAAATLRHRLESRWKTLGRGFFYEPALSRDGSRLWVGKWPLEIQRWDLGSGRLLDRTAIQTLIPTDLVATSVLRDLRASSAGVVAIIDPERRVLGHGRGPRPQPQFHVLRVDEDLTAATSVLRHSTASRFPIARLSSDGRRWWGLNTEGRLTSDDLADDEPPRTRDTGKRVPAALAVSPDDRWIALAGGHDGSSATALLCPTDDPGSCRDLPDPPGPPGTLCWYFGFAFSPDGSRLAGFGRRWNLAGRASGPLPERYAVLVLWPTTD